MIKRILPMLFLVGNLGCLFSEANIQEDSSHPKTNIYDDMNLDDIFQRWEKGVEAELHAENSWVYGPKTEREYLASHVSTIPLFFLEKLKKNMFVVVILDGSELRREHDDQFLGIEGMQGRQQVWLAILEKCVGIPPASVPFQQMSSGQKTEDETKTEKMNK